MKKLLYIILLIVHCQLSIVQSQWVQQTVPVSKPIQGIKFINSNTGWACTGNTGSPNEGYVLNTTNGGTNWVIQLTAPSVSFNAICVINNVIYAGGTDGTGKLYKSTNSGVNWVNIGVPSKVTDMVFLNQDSGYYCADFIGADVRTTTNGGMNWIVRINGIASQTLKLFFLNYNTGFCGANNDILYKTTNAGLNWNPFYNTSSQIYSVFFLNEQIGWVGITNNRIEYTSNSGSNWNEQTISPPSGPIYALHFFNQSTGWAGVTSDYIFKTTNGGLNWGYQNVVTGSREFCFVDTSYGWCGYLAVGLVSKTTNGGGNITYSSIQQISNETPVNYSLGQNYPNPFNPTTKINFDVNSKSNVKLLVFDALGRIVSELVNTELNSGKYEYIFEAENLPSGIYFYKLITEGYTQTKKMILLK